MAGISISATEPLFYVVTKPGSGLFEAVSRAMNWFADPYWKGPEGSGTVIVAELKREKKSLKHGEESRREAVTRHMRSTPSTE